MSPQAESSSIPHMASPPRSIHMVRALLGFERLQHFELGPIDEAPPFWLLQSTEDEEIAFFLLASSDLPIPYSPTLPDWAGEVLGMQEGAAVELYALLSLDGAGGGTANLRAPLLVDPDSGRAMQVVLDGDWSMRAPLRAEGGGK